MTSAERASRVVAGVVRYMDSHAIDGLLWAIAKEIDEALAEAAGQPAPTDEQAKYALRAALASARACTTSNLEIDEIKARVRTFLGPHVKGGK